MSLKMPCKHAFLKEAMNRFLPLLLILGLFPVQCFLLSQNPLDQTQLPSKQGLLPDQIKSQLQLTEEDDALDTKTKESVTVLYRLALERLESVVRYKLEADQYRQSIETSGDATKSIRNQLESLPSLTGANAQTNHIADIKEGITSNELEQLITAEKAKLTDLRNALSTTEADILAQTSRPEKNRQELDEARKKLIEINTALAFHEH